MHFLIADAGEILFETVDRTALLRIPVAEIGFIDPVTAQGDRARDKALTIIYGDDAERGAAVHDHLRRDRGLGRGSARRSAGRPAASRPTDPSQTGPMTACGPVTRRPPPVGSTA